MLTQYPSIKTLLPGLVLLLVAAPGAGWAACDLIVGSTANAGGTCINPPANPNTCTLRQAIATAAANQTICFAESLKGNTISLATLSLTINKNLTIRGFGGPASNGITISGSNAVRIFTVGCTGGGACNPSPSANTVTFDGLILQNGFVSNARGGAIRQTDSANTTVFVLNSTFLNNSASQAGGAIANRDGSLTVRNSTFSGNVVTGSAGNNNGGGAIYVETNGPSLTLENSTFFNNQTTTAALGDAIRIASGSTALLNNNTFSNNSAGTNTDGINNAGTLTLQNNILTGTTCNSSVAITGNNNLINGATSGSNTTACGLTDGSNGNKIGSFDPALVALADNGGPTQTMAIPNTSPAYNAGGTNCVSTDQRGVTRPQFDTCDMGAFEFSATLASLLGQQTPLTNNPQPCATTADLDYPQLSLQGVCNAQLTLRNTSNQTLTNITFKVNEISVGGVNPTNWILNGVRGPDQVGAIVAGPLSLAASVDMIPVFKIGLLSRDTYKLRFSAFGTPSGGRAANPVHLGDFEAELKPGPASRR
ncbi:MAG: right-handed parallel beta-helix repeat-containing protein [Candidatus Competibacter sp.]|nr:right-handed parallel beta-helix repeat-containing protein [Candidatus Competibacter sp.]